MTSSEFATNLSHVELGVSDYAKSIRFYDLVLKPLGWERIACTKSHTVFCDGFMKLVLSPVEERFKEAGFHRKRVGLNHLAFYAKTKQGVDSYFQDILEKNDIPTLYQKGPFGDEDYYAVYFEDPDRMKLEVVYAPTYPHRTKWQNKIQSDFDPYKN